MPAMARHSCIPSANYVVFGDALMARAARDLRAGDEVTFSMFDVYAPLEARQDRALERGEGFLCTCPRCLQETDFGPEVDAASERLRKRFDEQYYRIQAVRTELQVKTESQNKAAIVDLMAANRIAMDWRQNLFGLGEQFRTLNGEELSSADVQDLAREEGGLPSETVGPVVRTPMDLIDVLCDAVNDYEDAIEASDLSDDHRMWCRASNFSAYNDLLLLLGTAQHAESQRAVVPALVDSIEAVTPGSFLHQRMAVLNWELAVQPDGEDEDEAGPQSEPGADERRIVSQALRLRYGEMSAMEEDAAMMRVTTTQDIDENWCWEVSWCIGAKPNEVPIFEEGELDPGLTDPNTLEDPVRWLPAPLV